MGQSMMKGNRIATTGALSLIVIFTVLLNDCSGNQIESFPFRPPTDHVVEIAGMGAYHEGGPGRILGIVINEYQYYKSEPVPAFIRLDSPRVSGDKELVRQSVCYDNARISKNFETSDLESVRDNSYDRYLRICKERPWNRIVKTGQFTFAMLEEAVEELHLSKRPAYKYRIDENGDPLSFDLQFGYYSLVNQWSGKAMIRRPDWQCEEQKKPGQFECLFQPNDAYKRIIRGI